MFPDSWFLYFDLFWYKNKFFKTFYEKSWLFIYLLNFSYDAKLYIKRLPSLIIPNTTLVWHVKPSKRLQPDGEALHPLTPKASWIFLDIIFKQKYHSSLYLIHRKECLHLKPHSYGFCIVTLVKMVIRLVVTLSKKWQSNI